MGVRLVLRKERKGRELEEEKEGLEHSLEGWTPEASGDLPESEVAMRKSGPWMDSTPRKREETNLWWLGGSTMRLLKAEREHQSAHSRDQGGKDGEGHIDGRVWGGGRPPSESSAQDRKLSNSSVTLWGNDRLAK